VEEVKVVEFVRNWLLLRRLKFVDLDELRELEKDIRREVGMECYYYVDEYPTVRYREFGPHETRMYVEEAVDAVRCTTGEREVDLVYVEMRRGVVEFADGKQFWLIVDFAVEEDLEGGE